MTLSILQRAQALSLDETTWGVAGIRADQVWRGLGVVGDGITVAIIDSGVDWQHPALMPSYRGWTGGPAVDHVNNWFDATNEQAAYPNDLNGHGTHVMGTIAGQGGIGVAPGARWMAAKGLSSQGYGLYSWLHASFQFLLAPHGDPTYAPDIVSNSWGNDDGTDREFEQDIAALQAAGIFVVFANGNTGPQPGTVGSPASLPNSVGVGATDADDQVALFSSRGPSPFGPPRPHLSAPGVAVLSAYPGGAFAYGSGTSMATPHVAGVAALLLSARPSLDIRDTLYALTRTAVPLSTTIPNNDSGWGRVDAYSAVLSVISTGVILGQVVDAAQPISGALVTVYSAGRRASATTDAGGRYSIPAPFGIYTASAVAFGYAASTSGARLVVTNTAVTIDFDLSMLPSGIVRGVVTDIRTGAYVTSAVVRALGTPEQSRADGSVPPRFYTLNLPAGTYTVEARALGFVVQTRTVTVYNDSVAHLDFALAPAQRIALVDTGSWYYGSAVSFYRAALDALSLPYDEYRVKRIPHDTPTITQLLQYDTVIWSAPYDSPGLVRAGETISAYLSAGRNLMISGQDIAFYDGGGQRFLPYFPRLNAAYFDDESNSRTVIGPPKTLLAGKVLTITGGDGADNQATADLIGLISSDAGNLFGKYTGGENGRDGAAVYASQCLKYRSAYLAFGFEAIHSASERTDVMRRVLQEFATPRPTAGIELQKRETFFTDVGIGLPGSVVTHVFRLRHTGDAGVTDTLTLALSGNRWATGISRSSAQLAPCASVLITLTVAIPPAAQWDTRDIVTVTAMSALSPTLRTALTLTTKTPAGILLVDDDRFFNREQDYLDALAAQGNHADRWDTRWVTGIGNGPPAPVLRMYPLVIWFNAYDWYDPIQPGEEADLRQYLDGGGRLFFTSQAALAYTELSRLVQHYFGVASIDYADVTSNVVGGPGNVIGDGFAGGTLLTQGGKFPYNWNLSTAVQPMSNTLVILRGDSGQPFGLARDCPANCDGGRWRAAFMPFAFEALTATARADLMNRVVGWLSWLGRSQLTPDRVAVAPGGQIRYTLRLEADRLITPSLMPSLTQSLTVSISAPVAANLYILSSTLPGASTHNAGAWRGRVRPGQVLTWTFVAASSAGLSPGTPLTASVRFAIEEIGLRFTRDAVARVSAPDLVSSLALQPAPPAWRGRVTATLRVTNSSAIAAPAASITSVIPTGMRLITTTLIPPPTGVATASGNRIVWSGGLAPGAAIAFTYQISVPALKPSPREFYHAALVDDGAGRVTHAAAWITPRTSVYWFPRIMR